MTLRIIEGFDNSRLPFGWTTSGSRSFPAGRLGGRALMMNQSGSGSSACTVTAPLGFAIAAGSVGVAAYAQAANPGTMTPAGFRFVQLRSGATCHLGVQIDEFSRIQLATGAGVVLGTGPVIDPAAWQHYEITFVIDDVAGSAQLRVNGALVVDVSGVDTRNGANATVDTLWVGGASAAQLNVRSAAIDDLFVTDADGAAPYNGSLGDCRVETLRPVGNGAANEWVGSDANSVDNWQLVDDDATSTDYVASDVPGARDLYALTDPTGVDMGDVLAVQVELFAAKSDAGNPAGDLLAVLRNAAGTEASTTAATPAELNTAYAWRLGGIATTDPAGDPWTIDRVAGLQAGPALSNPTP